MANMTNFKPGETLTAEALNQAFSLVGARADAVIGIAQEAKDDAAEALARVDQATERVPELIEKVEEMEDVIPTLATEAAVVTAQEAAEAYADTVGVNAATTAKAYTDTQVTLLDSQIDTLSSETTALSGDVEELEEALEDKADSSAVYTKDEVYTKAQTNALYDVLPQLSSGTLIAQIKTPAGTKPLYAPQGGSGGSSVEVDTIVTTGTHIADITVDGVEYELYAPTGGAGGVTIEEVIAEIEEHLEAYSTTAQVNVSLALKADKATTYTKTEVDNALSAKANSSSVYTKTEVYTKAEVDDLIPEDTAPVHYSTKECDIDIVDNSAPYTFQYHNGYWTPNNHKVSASTAVIKLKLSNFRGSSVPVKVYTDSELNYDKCIITYGGSDTQLCAVSGEAQDFEYSIPVSGYSFIDVTIKYQKDNSGDKGVDSCAVQIGTAMISAGGGGGEFDPTQYYTKSQVDTKLGDKLDSSIYYGYVNNRPVDTYLYINYPGMPETADADFTVYASLNNDPTKNYEVTVVLDDPALKFKSITYDTANTRYAITFPKEAAGHTCRVHIQEVPS